MEMTKQGVRNLNGLGPKKKKEIPVDAGAEGVAVAPTEDLPTGAALETPVVEAPAVVTPAG